MRKAKILVAIAVAVIVSGVGLQQASATSYPSRNATVDAVWKHPEVKKGSKGNAVYAVQLALWHMGYLKGSKSSALDSNFGSKTDSAVRAFQKASWHKPLTVDGKVGSNSWKELWNYCYIAETPSCVEVYNVYITGP